jgi:DNA-binding response OmpR family regulator
LSPSCTNGRVLVVDDERLIADSLSLILKSSGYDAASAYDGESAFDIALGFRPHVLITDIVMPGINGIVLATRVRERLPDCRILLFSGQVGVSSLIESARTSGLRFDIMPKPIHPSEVLRLLSGLLPGNRQ